MLVKKTIVGGLQLYLGDLIVDDNMYVETAYISDLEVQDTAQIGDTLDVAGVVTLSGLASDDTEDHVVAIDDTTGLLTKRSVASITPSVSLGATTQIPYTNPGATDFIYSSSLTFSGVILKTNTVQLQSGVAVDEIETVLTASDTNVPTSGAVTTAIAASAMVYPAAGIALSTGAAWSASITNNSGNWNTAFGWGNHAGLYDPTGTAAAAVSAHESTYNHTNYNTAYAHVSLTNNPHAVTEVQVLPTQTGHSGEFLTTDGTNSSWAAAGGGGVTLSGSTNNTVTTVTGANAIQGEGNLLFDGSLLDVTGAIEASGEITAYA